MAQLKNLAFRKQRAKSELRAFKALLDGKGKGDLVEAKDILPFFDANEQLCVLMGMYNPNIVDYKNISVAREFSIFGDHKADLVIGDTKNKQFCFIEFEDAKSISIFNTARKKATPEWSIRYDHGFSQLVDWILWIGRETGTQLVFHSIGSTGAWFSRFRRPALRSNRVFQPQFADLPVHPVIVAERSASLQTDPHPPEFLRAQRGIDPIGPVLRTLHGPG